MTDGIRRRRRRVSAMGGSSGGSATNSNHSVSTDPDADINDYPDIDEVQQAPTQRAPTNYDPLDPTVAEEPNNRPMTPEEILRDRGGKDGKATKTQRDMRLRMVSRAMMRGIDEATMAQANGTSVAQVRKDVRMIRELMAKQASELDIHSYLGETLNVHRDVQELALRIASKSKATDGVKLAALRTALSAKADSARVMKLAGVFDVLPFTSSKVEHKSDIELLSEMTKALMAIDLEDQEISDEDRDILQALGTSPELDYDDDGSDDDIRLI